MTEERSLETWSIEERTKSIVINSAELKKTSPGATTLKRKRGIKAFLTRAAKKQFVTAKIYFELVMIEKPEFDLKKKQTETSVATETQSKSVATEIKKSKTLG